MVQPKTERHIVMWYLPIWENQVFFFCLRWSLSGGNPPNPPYVSKLTVQFENTRFRLLSCLGLKLNFAPVPLFHSELWITINLDSLAHFYFTLINESWKGSQLLHPKATTSLMALHPKGKKVVHYIPGPLHPKWHYIQKATTSHKPLHPTMLLHPTYHFITFATSSQMSLHPICHFIP